MTARTLLALSLAPVLALGAVVVPLGAAAQAAPERVVVDDMAFKPGRVTVRIGQRVVWKFEDSVQHTATSNQGFWDSGTSSAGDRYTHEFVSAGTYPYHCEFHPSMTGRVRVRMTADGRPARGWTVRWATMSAPVGRDYDVQYRRSGQKGWTSLVENATEEKKRFNPSRDGTYLLRARTGNTNASTHSAWSPVKRLKIR